MPHAVEALCAMEIGLAKLMEADGLDFLVQKVQERLFPQRTAEARELLKQGMRVGGPMKPSPRRTDDELHLASSSLVARARDVQHARAR